MSDATKDLGLTEEEKRDVLSDEIQSLRSELDGTTKAMDRQRSRAKTAETVVQTLQAERDSLEKDLAGVRETIEAVRKRAERAESHAKKAEEVAHQLEKERDDLKADLLGKATSKVSGRIYDTALARISELERLLAHARDTAAENLEAKRVIQARCAELEKKQKLAATDAFRVGQAYHEQSQRMRAAETRCKALEGALREMVIAVSLEIQARPPCWRFSTPRLEQADTAARAVLSNIDLASRRTADTGTRRDRHAPSGLEESEPGSAVVSRTGPRSPVPTPQPRRTQEGCNKLPTGESPKEGRQEGEPGQRDARLAAADVGGSTGEVIAGSTGPQRTAVPNLGGQGSPVQSHGDNPDPAAKPRSVGGGHDRSGKSPGTGNVAEPQLGPDSAPRAEPLPSISDPPAPEQGETEGKGDNHG